MDILILLSRWAKADEHSSHLIPFHCFVSLSWICMTVEREYVEEADIEK